MPQHRGLEKKVPQNSENCFSDADGQVAAALLHKIQSGQITKETVELSKIERHEYLKIRHVPDKDTNDELVGKLRNGQSMSPVILMPDPELSEIFRILDGDLRFTAKRNLRLETTEAIVVA